MLRTKTVRTKGGELARLEAVKGGERTEKLYDKTRRLCKYSTEHSCWYEAIFRKPLDERLAMGLTMVGFVFIVGLMIMVLGLDIHRMGTWLFQ